MNRFRRFGLARLPTWLGLALLAACGDDLPRKSEIRRSVPLGVVASVEGDPTRTSPRPGEAVSLRFEVVSPSGRPDPSQLRSLFISCTYPEAFTGVPQCQEFIDLARQGGDSGLAGGGDAAAAAPVRCAAPDGEQRAFGVKVTCVSGPPVVVDEVPADFAAERRLLRGVICDRGTPYIDVTQPVPFGCELQEGGAALPAYASVRIARAAADDNRAPDAGAIALALDGRPWLEPGPEPAPEQGCRGAVDGARLLAADPFEHTLTVAIDATAREQVAGAPEALELQLYATAGDVGRHISLIAGSEAAVDGTLRVEIPWDAPDPEPLTEAGQVVRLYLALLDQRGGFVLLERQACVYVEPPL